MLKYFNGFITSTNPLMAQLDEKNVFEYIEECIIIITNLIKAQPFTDGNKRTFRALLNLMLKRKNLPPVTIQADKKDKYKELLLEAMKGNYEGLVSFYFYEICNSIVDLDIQYKNLDQDHKLGK